MGIQFVNQSTVVSADALAAFQEDVIAQLTNDLAPVWGRATVPAGVVITLLDEPGSSDPSGALGYHDVTGAVPYGRIFCKLAEDNGIAWSIVASHETLELSVDQRCNQATYLSNPAGTSGWLVIDEVCDPVEMQSYPGSLHQTPLSNFVLPGWYMPGYTGQVDFWKLLGGPLKIASGGYASAAYVQSRNGWQSFNDFMKQANNPM